MSVTTKYYYGDPGAYSLTDSELAYVTILKVTRSGMTFVKTGNATAGSLQYVYSSSAGQISFDPTNPFTGVVIGGRPVPLSSKEKISVKFKV